MDKDKILGYVMNSPANTNPNVLKTMLDDSGSEMNPGYSCTETVTLLTDESVTTVFDEVNNSGTLAYSTSIDADTIRVTFDGTEYNCNVQEGPMGKLYGAPMGEKGVDWSDYPFQISSGLRNDLYTETAGTYQIKIETVEEVVETSPCFEKAVNSVVGGGSGGSGGGGYPGYSCKEEITTVVNEKVTTVKPTDPGLGSPYPFGDISYNKLLDSETINVKFNGVDYTCEQLKIDDRTYYYGATGDLDFDWSNYPFRIVTSINPIDESEGNILYTENPGVYDIKIDEVKITVDITPCFEAAVKKATSVG